MTEFDHEIIAALAEGRLPAAEAADLEARIAADPVASAELEAQRAALAALAAAPAPALDDLERRRLHRSIAAELDIVLPSTTSGTPRRRFNLNWAALATTAAVLLTVALVAPVLSLLNTSDDGAADTTTAAAAAAEAASDEDAADEAAPPETVPAEQLAAAEAPADTIAPEATGAAADTTSVADAAPESTGDFYGLARATLPDLGELEGDLGPALSLRLRDLAIPFSDDTADGEAGFPCADQVADELDRRQLDPATPSQVLALALRDGVPVYVVQLGDSADGRDLLLLTIDECVVAGDAVVE